MFVDKTPFDILEQLVHIFGIPAILGVIVWAVRAWDKGQTQIKAVADDTRETRRMSMETLGSINIMQSVHLDSIKKGTDELVKKSDKTIEVLGSIDKGIAIIADRRDRQA
jgi:hypothetical protein